MKRRHFLASLAALPVAVAVAIKAPLAHALGTFGAAPNKFYPQVNGAHQAGSLLRSDGWRPGEVLYSGDVFTIAGVRQCFIVTATVTAGRDGAVDMPIHPPIIPSGMYQNIDGPIVNDALILM